MRDTPGADWNRGKTRLSPRLDRRTLLWSLLGLLGLRRSARAVATRRYRELARPVSVALATVAETWHPIPFRAWGSTPGLPPGQRPNRLLRGVLLRVPKPARDATELKAFCLTCPHEICQVQFTLDTESVRVAPATKPDHPLFLCPCHFSVFDPLEGGAPIAGPVERGLYLFGTRVEGEQVEIHEVEEEALA